MIECLIAGDSIALAVSAYLRGCAVNAKIGIGSHAIIERVQPARRVILSAGSNDPDNPRLSGNLEQMRGLAATRTIWILPVNHKAAAAVYKVANLHGDVVIRFASGRDHVHPKCDRCVAKDIEKAYAAP